MPNPGKQSKGASVEKENDIGKLVVAAAIRIHRDLGPGLHESVYESVLEQELRVRGLRIERPVSIAVQPREALSEEAVRANLVVDESVVVQIRSVEAVRPIHREQLLTHLRRSGYRLGYLLAFGESTMKDGIIRCTSELTD